MKRRLSLIFLSAVACLVVLPLQAQLVFSQTKWNFGTIEESAGRVHHTFSAENTGDKPIVILEVATSCGCTASEYSRQPILPGQKTQIKVSYDPMDRPGTFTKMLAVFSSERKKIATLLIEGNVTPRARSVKEQYPFEAGSGLRFATTSCNLYTVGQGILTQAVYEYVNTSDQTLQLELRPVESSGYLKTIAPGRITAGKKGAVNISYLIPPEQPHYGSLNDALQVWVDGRFTGTELRARAIGVDAPEKTNNSKTPKAELNTNILKFGEIKHDVAPQEQKFTLRNSGEAPLVVRAVESGGKATLSLAPGTTIAPGASLTVKVALNPSKMDFGLLTDYLLLVTNDTQRPVRNLRVTAIVEE